MPGKPKPMLNRPRGKVSDLRKKFNPRTGEETNKPGGKDPRTIYRPKPDVKPTEMKTGGLSPKQKAIASKAPPPDKIDGKDFAVLKAEKAKGRGMGLQDESIKPGKVQKAFLGKMIKGAGKSIGRLFGKKKSATATPGAMVSQKASLPINIVEEYKKAKGLKVGGNIKAKTGKMVPLKKDPTKPISSVAPKTSDALKKKKLPGRIGTALGVVSMLVPAGYAAAKQYKDYKSAKNRDEAKVKKMGGGMMQKPMGYRSGGHYDDKNKNVVKHIRVKKKMGGGMIGPSQRPGYLKGTMVKARGCKLGRTRPTKIT